MSDRTWHKGWNEPDGNPERHSGCPHDHHASYQDDEPHMRFRGNRSDIHEDRGDPPEHHLRNEYGDRERDQDGSPDGSVQPHDGGNLGWEDAWDDAGGFEAMLLGHLSDTLGPAGGFPQIIVFAIDDLDVEFNSLIQTTQIQNTLVFLNASAGGSIDIGGDVDANGFQSASVEHSTALMSLPDFA
jgi:hypothetical protein